MTGPNPALVHRPGRPPRVSFLYWLRHPWRAWWVRALVHEAFRWGTAQNPDPAALSYAERALFRRAQAAQARATAKVVARIESLAVRFQALQAEVRRHNELAELARRRKIKPKIKIKVYAAEPIDRKDAKKIVKKCRERVRSDTDKGQTRHLEHPSRARDAGMYAPLAVDIVALCTLIAKFYNITPENMGSKLPDTFAAIGFALITSFVLGLLAHSAGSSAWQARATSGGGTANGLSRDDADEPAPREFPSTKGLLYVKLAGLFIVSGLTATSIVIRIMHPTDTVSTGGRGLVIGLMVGLAAFMAPWLVVLNCMRSGSLEVRTIEDLTNAMTEIDDAVTKHEKAIVETQERASNLRAAAEQSQDAGRKSTDELWNICQRVLDLARSYHRAAGRYAIDESAAVDVGHVSIQSLRDSSLEEIREAMKAFDVPDGTTESPVAGDLSERPSSLTLISDTADGGDPLEADQNVGHEGAG